MGLDLPHEILLHIMGYTDRPTWGKFAQVSKSFAEYAARQKFAKQNDLGLKNIDRFMISIRYLLYFYRDTVYLHGPDAIKLFNYIDMLSKYQAGAMQLYKALKTCETNIIECNWGMIGYHIQNSLLNPLTVFWASLDKTNINNIFEWLNYLVTLEIE